jgi:hypothetical protein
MLHHGATHMSHTHHMQMHYPKQEPHALEAATAHAATRTSRDTGTESQPRHGLAHTFHGGCEGHACYGLRGNHVFHTRYYRVAP